MPTYHTPQQLGTRNCAYHGCTQPTHRYHNTTDGYRIGYCTPHYLLAEALFTMQTRTKVTAA